MCLGPLIKSFIYKGIKKKYMRTEKLKKDRNAYCIRNSLAKVYNGQRLYKNPAVQEQHPLKQGLKLKIVGSII